MALSSVMEARRLDLAERVACRHGLIVVPGFIGALIERLETEPGTITSAELEAIRYAIATATVDETGGGIKSLEGSGVRTGGGGLRVKTVPPFIHAKRPI